MTVSVLRNAFSRSACKDGLPDSCLPTLTWGSAILFRSGRTLSGAQGMLGTRGEILIWIGVWKSFYPTLSITAKSSSVPCLSGCLTTDCRNEIQVISIRIITQKRCAVVIGWNINAIRQKLVNIYIVPIIFFISFLKLTAGWHWGIVVCRRIRDYWFDVMLRFLLKDCYLGVISEYSAI